MKSPVVYIKCVCVSLEIHTIQNHSDYSEAKYVKKYTVLNLGRLILKLHMWIQCYLHALKSVVVNCYKGENNLGNLNENKSINLYYS